MKRANLEDRSERVLGRILQRQAEKIPDQMYIMAGEDQYTYGQVNEMASSQWPTEGMTIVVVGDRSVIDQQLAHVEELAPYLPD